MKLFPKLKRSIQILCVVLLGCSSILGVMLMWQYRQHAVSAEISAQNLMQFIEVVKALNTISAERGPTNAIVAAQGDRPDLAAKLAAIRRSSDEGLARAAANPALAEQVAGVRDRLRRARSIVDAIVAQPAARRTIADVEKAVAEMVAVIDAADTLVEDATDPVTNGSSSVAGYAVLIRALSDIRDYAGRMGSALMVPLALKQPIAPAQRTVFDSAEGRVFEIYHLVSGTIATTGDAAVRRALDDVTVQFFGSGMSLFRHILDAGRDGTYPMDREAFTAAVQPGFRTLEGLRDAVAEQARRTIEAERLQARWSFTIVAAIIFVMIALEFTLILAAQRLIFRPLLGARRAILDLATGRSDDLMENPRAIGEMGELFGALALLKRQINERDALDRENRHLTARLRDLADHDGLTAILNRGALERIVQKMVAGDGGPATLGLILFDIDHFKAINDSFGHSGGDDVLRLLTARWAERLPEDTIFARYGGEEFAVVVPDGLVPLLRPMAEMLREAAEVPVPITSGALVPVSASFGVASVPRTPNAWPILLQAADAALYTAKRCGRNIVVCDGDVDAGPEIAAAA